MTGSHLAGKPDGTSETMEQGVEITHCDTLDQFWNLVSPVGEYFGRPPSEFVFRGQGNSRWKLVPKVFRTDVLKKYKRGIASLHRDHPGHFFYEWYLLHRFMGYCDARGLAIPNDSMDFRKYFCQDNITTLHGKNTHSWPEERVVPLMALAQHHGIPTRLLDWSSNPYVACYHAAASAVTGDRECIKDSDEIALFALDLTGIHANAKDIKPVRVPGSTSANIFSQGGLFILVNHSGWRGEEFTYDMSLESKLPTQTNILQKITLPASFSGDLLLRCDKFGVSAASMFPGYDGVARAVLESTLAYHFNS
jgi:hypothetical protein